MELARKNKEQTKAKKKKEPKKMAKEPEKEKTHDKPEQPTEATAAAEQPKTSVATGDSNSVALTRSAAEQSVIDTLGTDPSKYKEGSHERELVEALPENIAKKAQKEQEEKQGK